MQLIFSYIDQETRNPTTFISFPITMADFLKNEITQLLKTNQTESYFKHNIESEQKKVLNRVFTIPSEWAPNKQEIVMISFIIEKKLKSDHFKPIIETYSNQIKEIPNIFKAFYRKSKKAKYDVDIQPMYSKLRDKLSLCLDDFVAKARSLARGNIVIVGLPDAGKTCLINYLNLGEFIQDIPSSEEINVFDIEIANYSYTYYDIPGKHDWYQHTEFSIKEIHAIVCLFDVNSNKEQIKEFKQKTEKYLEDLYIKKGHILSRNVPILLLGNKTDLAPKYSVKDLKSLIKIEKYTDIPHYALCSVKMKQNVKETLELFVRETAIGKAEN
jgi:small GTP-binding protein